MKKLVIASIALAGLCSGAVVSLPALAQGVDGQAAAQGGGANCSQITIKDAAEYNAYANATSQSDPKAKAAAIEAFLTQYPNSVAKAEMLGDLMGAYQAAGNAPKMLDAAKRLLQADPNNLRALTTVVYLEHQSANGNQTTLDDAATVAQQGLNAKKDTCTTQADYDKLKGVATPIFYEAIAADDSAKKDYKGAIDAYTKELQSYADPTATTQVPALLDTYYLGNVYLQEDPKDLKDAIWFLTRAAQFVPDPKFKQPIETAAEYWYKKYHCSPNDAACNATPPQGFAAIQQLAAVPANVFPPASYNITQAPPPPSPAELAHTAIVSTTGCAGVTPDPPKPPPTTPEAAATPASAAAPTTPPAPAAATTPAAAPSFPAACTDALKKSIGLPDEEFILANGDPQDQQLIWSIMQGVTAKIPGTVISATADSVQLAVTPDAQQSQKADFTVNMKAPLKPAEVPAVGAKTTFIATFDSYTQNPPMIILKDGEPEAAPKPPVHHAPAHRPAH